MSKSLGLILFFAFNLLYSLDFDEDIPSTTVAQEDDQAYSAQYPYPPAAHNNISFNAQAPKTSNIWMNFLNTQKNDPSEPINYWKNWKGVGRSVFGIIGIYHVWQTRKYLNNWQEEEASRKDLYLAALHSLPLFINIMFQAKLVSTQVNDVVQQIESYGGLIELPIYIGWGFYKLYNKLKEVEEKKQRKKISTRGKEDIKKKLQKLQELVDKLD